MHLAIKPVTLILAAVAPYEPALPLHFISFPATLIICTIKVSVLALALLDAVDEVTFVEGAVQVLLGALTVEFTIDFSAVLGCSLSLDRFPHRHDYL